jgi:predicted AAA+ superfamily ATPase
VINRNLKKRCLKLASVFPVLALTGPRQSGKTTLLQNAFPKYEYLNLENPDVLEFAQNDPADFIRNNSKIIIDEIQRFPKLLSYIQTTVDKRKIMGDFIISGSQNLLLSDAIGQSLAGRAAYATLFPFSINELKNGKRLYGNHLKQIFTGFFPAIYDRNIKLNEYYSQYLATYVERDLKSIKAIHNLTLFRKFLRITAGRIGQVVNMQSLANDVGVSQGTVGGWLSILESSYIIKRIAPYYENFGKRNIKMPKLYFTDTGLACYLLGIKTSEQLKTHYLIGGLFENMVIMDVLKNLRNDANNEDIYFYRSSSGNEVDLIVETEKGLLPIEIKASSTFTKNFLKGLNYWQNIVQKSMEGIVVYTGKETRKSDAFKLVNWSEMEKQL